MKSIGCSFEFPADGVLGFVFVSFFFFWVWIYLQGGDGNRGVHN